MRFNQKNKKIITFTPTFHTLYAGVDYGSHTAYKASRCMQAAHVVRIAQQPQVNQKPIHNAQQSKAFFNYTFDKGRLKSLVSWTLENYGHYKTVELLDQLKKIGFEYATKAGISLGIDDLKIPPKKQNLLVSAEKLTKLTQYQYERADITAVERFQRLIETWHRTSEQIKQEVINHFEETDVLNPVYMMAFSGARGNISQVRQLVGMRGLMSNPQGQIIDFPIRSNFREGLTLTEYIISSYGARKGIVDTALRTANAGYLTRRLVDVAQHVIISHFDCGTQKGIFLTDIKDNNKTAVSVQKRIVGRVLARDIYKPNTTQKEYATKELSSGTYIKVFSRNQEISSDIAFEITKFSNKIFVRSPLTCNTTKLLCQLCYGWSLAQGNLVSVGEAVGVIAAQSIGEPGTQLTMRTFHTGGVFAGDVSDEIRAPYNGFVYYEKSIPGILMRAIDGKILFLTKSDGTLFFSKHSLLKTNNSNLSDIKKYKIPAYTILFMRNGEEVYPKQVVAQITSIQKKSKMYNTEELVIKSDFEGMFYGKNLIIQKSIIGPKPKYVGKDKDILLIDPQAMEIIIKARGWNFGWVLSGKRYELPLLLKSFPIIGDYITPQTIITRHSLKLPSNTKNQYKTFNTFKLNKVNQKTNLNYKTDNSQLPLIGKNHFLPSGYIDLAKQSFTPNLNIFNKKYLNTFLKDLKTIKKTGLSQVLTNLLTKKTNRFNFLKQKQIQSKNKLWNFVKQYFITKKEFSSSLDANLKNIFVQTNQELGSKPFNTETNLQPGGIRPQAGTDKLSVNNAPVLKTWYQNIKIKQDLLFLNLQKIKYHKHSYFHFFNSDDLIANKSTYNITFFISDNHSAKTYTLSIKNKEPQAKHNLMRMSCGANSVHNYPVSNLKHKKPFFNSNISYNEIMVAPLGVSNPLYNSLVVKKHDIKNNILLKRFKTSDNLLEWPTKSFTSIAKKIKGYFSIQYARINMEPQGNQKYKLEKTKFSLISNKVQTSKALFIKTLKELTSLKKKGTVLFAKHKVNPLMLSYVPPGYFSIQYYHAPHAVYKSIQVYHTESAKQTQAKHNTVYKSIQDAALVMNTSNPKVITFRKPTIYKKLFTYKKIYNKIYIKNVSISKRKIYYKHQTNLQNNLFELFSRDNSGLLKQKQDVFIKYSKAQSDAPASRALLKQSLPSNFGINAKGEHLCMRANGFTIIKSNYINNLTKQIRHFKNNNTSTPSSVKKQAKAACFDSVPPGYFSIQYAKHNTVYKSIQAVKQKYTSKNLKLDSHFAGCKTMPVGKPFFSSYNSLFKKSIHFKPQFKICKYSNVKTQHNGKNIIFKHFKNISKINTFQNPSSAYSSHHKSVSMSNNQLKDKKTKDVHALHAGVEHQVIKKPLSLIKKNFILTYNNFYYLSCSACCILKYPGNLPFCYSTKQAKKSSFYNRFACFVHAAQKVISGKKSLDSINMQPQEQLKIASNFHCKQSFNLIHMTPGGQLTLTKKISLLYKVKLLKVSYNYFLETNNMVVKKTKHGLMNLFDYVTHTGGHQAKHGIDQNTKDKTANKKQIMLRILGADAPRFSKNKSRIKQVVYILINKNLDTFMRSIIGFGAQHALAPTSMLRLMHSIQNTKATKHNMEYVPPGYFCIQYAKHNTVYKSIQAQHNNVFQKKDVTSTTVSKTKVTKITETLKTEFLKNKLYWIKNKKPRFLPSNFDKDVANGSFVLLNNKTIDLKSQAILIASNHPIVNKVSKSTLQTLEQIKEKQTFLFSVFVNLIQPENNYDKIAIHSIKKMQKSYNNLSLKDRQLIKKNSQTLKLFNLLFIKQTLTYVLPGYFSIQHAEHDNTVYKSIQAACASIQKCAPSSISDYTSQNKSMLSINTGNKFFKISMPRSFDGMASKSKFSSKKYTQKYLVYIKLNKITQLNQNSASTRMSKVPKQKKDLCLLPKIPNFALVINNYNMQDSSQQRLEHTNNYATKHGIFKHSINTKKVISYIKPPFFDLYSKQPSYFFTHTAKSMHKFIPKQPCINIGFYTKITSQLNPTSLRRLRKTSHKINFKIPGFGCKPSSAFCSWGSGLNELGTTSSGRMPPGTAWQLKLLQMLRNMVFLDSKTSIHSICMRSMALLNQTNLLTQRNFYSPFEGELIHIKPYKKYLVLNPYADKIASNKLLARNKTYQKTRNKNRRKQEEIRMALFDYYLSTVNKVSYDFLSPLDKTFITVPHTGGVSPQAEHKHAKHLETQAVKTWSRFNLVLTKNDLITLNTTPFLGLCRRTTSFALDKSLSKLLNGGVLLMYNKYLQNTKISYCINKICESNLKNTLKIKTIIELNKETHFNKAYNFNLKNKWFEMQRNYLQPNLTGPTEKTTLSFQALKNLILSANKGCRKQTKLEQGNYAQHTGGECKITSKTNFKTSHLKIKIELKSKILLNSLEQKTKPVIYMPSFSLVNKNWRSFNQKKFLTKNKIGFFFLKGNPFLNGLSTKMTISNSNHLFWQSEKHKPGYFSIQYASHKGLSSITTPRYFSIQHAEHDSACSKMYTNIFNGLVQDSQYRNFKYCAEIQRLHLNQTFLKVNPWLDKHCFNKRLLTTMPFANNRKESIKQAKASTKNFAATFSKTYCFDSEQYASINFLDYYAWHNNPKSWVDSYKNLLIKGNSKVIFAQNLKIKQMISGIKTGSANKNIRLPIITFLPYALQNYTMSNNCKKYDSTSSFDLLNSGLTESNHAKPGYFSIQYDKHDATASGKLGIHPICHDQNSINSSAELPSNFMAIKYQKLFDMLKPIDFGDKTSTSVLNKIFSTYINLQQEFLISTLLDCVSGLDTSTIKTKVLFLTKPGGIRFKLNYVTDTVYKSIQAKHEIAFLKNTLKINKTLTDSVTKNVLAWLGLSKKISLCYLTQSIDLNLVKDFKNLKKLPGYFSIQYYYAPHTVYKSIQVYHTESALQTQAKHKNNLVLSVFDGQAKQTQIFELVWQKATIFVADPLKFNAGASTNLLVIKRSGQLMHMNKQNITIRIGQPLVISPNSIIHASHGDFIFSKTPVINLTYQQLQTGDIVQGIPKIEQLFEARTTKRGRLFRDNITNLLTGLFLKYFIKTTYLFRKNMLNFLKKKPKMSCYASPGGIRPQYDKHNTVYKSIQGATSSTYNKTVLETIILSLALEWSVKQSFYKIQEIIVDGILRVYRSQGVSIADKHVEIIVKQMTSKVRIINSNKIKLKDYSFTLNTINAYFRKKTKTNKIFENTLLEQLLSNNLKSPTGLFPGEIVDLDFVENINTRLCYQSSAYVTPADDASQVGFGKTPVHTVENHDNIEPLKYEPIVLGITRASLEVESFLSAASFQQTTRVLSQAALYKKKDFLKGLKENIIIGNLIPAGTGYISNLSF